MKKMIVILEIIVGIIFILLLTWTFISGNRIREYKDEEGHILKGSLSEKAVVEINGVKNGFFINSKNTENPVLLLVSSGPGTDDYFLTERFDDMHIDDMFTLVYWDYRGMGIAYDGKLSPKSIDTKTLIEDTKAVTDYLKERFNQEKIYIMGFSGGTKICINAIEAYPDDYYAYIGMAQVVTDGPDCDELMYEFMKSVFEERNDTAKLEKLESLVIKENGRIRCKDWYSYVYLLHAAGGGTIYNETEFKGIDIPIMMSHCYTVREKINYIRGMKMYRKTVFFSEMKDFDFRNSHTEFDIPVYFLSGEYDYNCPRPLVKDYCEKIAAPDKGFYLIKNAAHSPLWENASESYEVLKEIKEKTLGKR